MAGGDSSVSRGQSTASASLFGAELVHGLLSLLLVLRLLPRGFRSGELRAHIAPLLAVDPSQYTQSGLTYRQRRLRLHGLIDREAASHRYTHAEKGLRVAMRFIQ